MTTYRYLLQIKGIGDHQAKKICDTLGISYFTEFSKLSQSRLENLNKLLASIRKNASSTKFDIHIEHGLSRFKDNAINRLIRINSYRGRRIKLGFPARGQRTRSNAITAAKRKSHR